MEKMSVKDFVMKSNGPKGEVLVATYQNGTLISIGEGGNRYLYVMNRSLLDWEREDLKYRTPRDAVRVVFDLHLSGKDGFISVHSDTPEELLHYGTPGVAGYRYYTWEEFSQGVEEVITRLKG